jgi:hypothetical protein
MRPIAGPASFPETTTTSSMQQTVAVAPQFREAPIAMIRPTMERRGLPAITLAPDRHTQEALRALRLFQAPPVRERVRQPIRASDSSSEAPARPEKVLVRKANRQRFGVRAARKEPKRRRGWHLLPAGTSSGRLDPDGWPSLQAPSFRPFIPENQCFPASPAAAFARFRGSNFQKTHSHNDQ